MVNITLSVSDELYKKMAKHQEYRWSEVARQAISEKIEEAELLRDLKAIKKAETEHRKGKTISYEALAKRLGLENEL
ncbi:Uncharacterised protein [Candidatus Gugararchaeum adminiculabundum]|nr:Uncharacterised protein [Candidatus Gugararchaeum adminiculabundum]